MRLTQNLINWGVLPTGMTRPLTIASLRSVYLKDRMPVVAGPVAGGVTALKRLGVEPPARSRTSMSKTSLRSLLSTTKPPRPAEAAHLPVEDEEVLVARTTTTEAEPNVVVADLLLEGETSEAAGEAGGIGRRFVCGRGNAELLTQFFFSPVEQSHARVVCGYFSIMVHAGRDRVPSSSQIETRG
jgi:hypothetical protein